MSMQSIDAVKEYSRSSAERLLAVDDRPEETVPNSLILIILCTMPNNLLYCLSIKNSNDCIKYSKPSSIHINKKG